MIIWCTTTKIIQRCIQDVSFSALAKKTYSSNLMIHTQCNSFQEVQENIETALYARLYLGNQPRRWMKSHHFSSRERSNLLYNQWRREKTLWSTHWGQTTMYLHICLFMRPHRKVVLQLCTYYKMFVMLKVFRLPPENPLVWQLSLTDDEIEKIVSGRLKVLFYLTCLT